MILVSLITQLSSRYKKTNDASAAQVQSLINKQVYISVAERDRQGFSGETLASPPLA